MKKLFLSLFILLSILTTTTLISEAHNIQHRAYSHHKFSNNPRQNIRQHAHYINYGRPVARRYTTENIYWTSSPYYRCNRPCSNQFIIDFAI